MKEVYESPMMLCEAFVATQSVAMSCAPEVNEDSEEYRNIKLDVSCPDTHTHNSGHGQKDKTFLVFNDKNSCDDKAYSVDKEGMFTFTWQGQNGTTHSASTQPKITIAGEVYAQFFNS